MDIKSDMSDSNHSTNKSSSDNGWKRSNREETKIGETETEEKSKKIKSNIEKQNNDDKLKKALEKGEENANE